MRLDEYARYDAIGLMNLIRSGEISQAEAQRCATDAMLRLNPRLNFLSGSINETPSWQENGPFSGLPFLVKEGHECKSYPIAMGTRMCAGITAPRDCEFVIRLKRAGVAIMGATTAPEFGIYPVTESGLHGATRNPWNLAHSPGGSSGGASVAVAAGVVPVAQTSDGGGSIRGPAHCTGIFGLKPSRGRTPVANRVLFGFPHVHVSTRTVRDSAAFLDVVRGPDLGARYWIHHPERPYLEEIKREPGRLRIGICRTSPFATALAPECSVAIEKTMSLLQSLGHDVDDASPEIDWACLMHRFLSAFLHPLPQLIKQLSALTGRKPGPDTLDAMTFKLLEYAQSATVDDMLAAEAAFYAARIAVDQFFLSHDLWITPSGVQQAPAIGQFDPNSSDEDAQTYTDRVFRDYAAFTPLLNITGHPAASVPLFHGENGLPVGIQLIAAMGDEATIFRLSAQLETATSWIDRHPPHSVFRGAEDGRRSREVTAHSIIMAL